MVSIILFLRSSLLIVELRQAPEVRKILPCCGHHPALVDPNFLPDFLERSLFKTDEVSLVKYHHLKFCSFYFSKDKHYLEFGGYLSCFVICVLNRDVPTSNAQRGTYALSFYRWLSSLSSILKCI